MECNCKVKTLFLLFLCLSLQPSSAGQLAFDAPYEESGGVVRGEAENYHAVTPQLGYSWTEQGNGSGVGATFTNASNGAFMQVTPDSNAISSWTTGPFIEYRMNITTTGTYRLWLKQLGHDGGADSIFAGIVELADGTGGVPDWYEDSFNIGTDFGAASWDGFGGAEENQAFSSQNSMVWTIFTPGIYTLRFVMREDGNALDEWVFQLNTLSEPDYTPPTVDVIGIEGFDYPDGTLAGQNGGVSFDHDNSTFNDSFIGHTGTSSVWTTVTGLGDPQISGGTLITNETAALRNYNGPTTDDQQDGAFGPQSYFDSHVVYLRAEMTRGVNTTWSGMSSYDYNTERILFGVPFNQNPFSGNREFAIHVLNNNAGEDGWSYSNIAPNPGQKYTLVGKIDYTNNLLSLYLDPDLGLPESSSTPIVTRFYSTGNWSTGVRLGSGSFFGSSFGNTVWDNLYVTNNWEGLYSGPPISNVDAYTMHRSGKARLDILKNDFGFLDVSTLELLTPPSHGTATINSDGTVLYTYTGTGNPSTDTFTYRVADSVGQFSESSTVTITFTSNYRFDSSFVNMPTAPPLTGYSLEEAFSGITFDSPHDFSSVPGDTDKFFVTEGDGKVYLLTGLSTGSVTKSLFLNILDRVNHDNNEVAMKGVVPHPDFATNGQIFVTYNTGGDPGTSVLSRFTIVLGNPQAGDPTSEVKLIDQSTPASYGGYNSYHTISVPRFGPDGYLYVGFGDGGTQQDDFNNSQRIDKDLWSCIIRIDPDKQDGNLEPNADADIPRDGSGKAYFSVPTDNPFVGAETFNGIDVVSTEIRTEIYCVGLRNPWQFSFNPGTNQLWIGDVGRDDKEEINILGPGQNGGWVWKEGSQNSLYSARNINGATMADATLTDPFYEYGHGGGAFEGDSVTGGLIYQGGSYPDLQGRYLFADYNSGNVWSLNPNDATDIVRISAEPAIVSLTTDPSNGDLLLLDRGNTGTTQGTGRILRLAITESDTTFPQTLTATGVYADLTDLAPNPGVIPYEVNLPFWSDYALKSRLFYIANTTDTMTYSRDGVWNLPDGMVMVKHFDLELVRGDPSTKKRIETRLLVKSSSGDYGVSYQWNDAETEATLVPDGGAEFDLNITVDGLPQTQRWSIPTRSSCLVCHHSQVGAGLSINTRQLNRTGELAGVSGNFLKLLNDASYIAGFTDDQNTLPHHVAAGETDYSLEVRVRSYLDVNCSYCHRVPEGTAPGSWDGRHHLTLEETSMINGTTVDVPLNLNHRLVIPGQPDSSIIWNRMATANGYSRMPGLATSELDEANIALVREWIEDELPNRSSYDEWRLSHFGDDTSAVGERTADPDGDGMANEEEFLFHTNPNIYNFTPTPTITLLDGGSATLELPAFPDRKIWIETSLDLGLADPWVNWSVEGNDGLPRAGSLYQLQGDSPDIRRFFRLRVEEN